MAFTAPLIGILSALGAAAAWGSGDFFGGLATRRNHPTLVLGVAAGTGLTAALIMALLSREALPAWVDVGWGAGAGVVGGLGLIALYRGLALGTSGGAGAALVAPIAAVVGAAVPVFAGSILEGLPSALQLTGFAAGIAGIWLVTRTPGNESVSEGISARAAGRGRVSLGVRLAVTAGLCFGAFFVLLAQVSPGQFYIPLALTKVAQVGMTAAVILAGRLRPGSPVELRAALLSGLLDAGGNVFFMIAKDYTRLDVASVLVAMYPVGTVLLSGIVLKEHVSPPQWAGILLCVAAVALIAA